MSPMVASDIKKRAHELIEALPDSATWSDILYSIELAADIQQGIVDADSGPLTGHDQMRRWLDESSRRAQQIDNNEVILESAEEVERKARNLLK